MIDAPQGGVSGESRRSVIVRLGVPGESGLFDAADLPIRRAMRVVIETDRGAEMGEVLRIFERRADERTPTHRVVRIATEGDVRAAAHNRVRELEAFQFCNERLRALKLPMKLVGAEIAHAGTRAVFYFESDDRVDFRALVKDLAQRFHTRIEMRQIGVRDAARHTGGFGLCGRELCCATWIPAFKPISIRMAKDQNLALNNQKLSGLCGRLRCCLEYEQELYHEQRRTLPKVGKRIITPSGEGRVKDVNVLTRRVRVQLNDGVYAEFAADEVTRPVDVAAPAPVQAAPSPGVVDAEGPQKKRRRRGRRRRRPGAPADEGGGSAPSGGNEGT
ncbi:MAG: regulatory iron-sulfur-containing complex subunit RicT [Myxococcota bacterium]